MRIALALALITAPCTARVAAQTATPTAGPPPAVFLDCEADSCDGTHIRNEIRFVDWMRDRTDADVHVLLTSQSTGGGGESYLLTLIGRGRFAGDSTDVRFVTDRNRTDAEQREALTSRIAQALVRYALRTSAASRLTVASSDPVPVVESAEVPRQDPWNYWVFGAGLNAELDGESREQSREFELELSADRVTEAWKVRLQLEATYDEQEFELTDRTIRSIQRDYEASGELAFAVGGQWSAGLRTELGSSSFENQDLFARTAALVEYSFLPYSQFSRRRVTLQYSVGARHFDYDQITIYDRLTEQRTDQRLELGVEFQQPWGSARVELSGAHFLDDVRRNNLSTWARLSVRLVRGLSLDFSADYERVRDQIYIPKGDATDEEVLLQRRALETGYRYGTSIGLRYTFGSIYNNIVNPRLDG